MPLLSCPLCSVSLSAASLEAHLRQELLYPALRCLLCRASFASHASAVEHFQGPLARHPGEPLDVMCLEKEPVKETRLLELLRLARGGENAVKERLCVCGQCRLLCRQDFRSAAGHAATLPQDRVWPQERRQEEVDQVQAQRWQPAEATEYVALPQARNRILETALPQPIEDPSEAENQSIDVKPNLEDLKPQLSADGKVACVQCGLRVGKERFKDHALGAHSSVRPFSCNLCPHNEKSKGLMGLHLRKEHKEHMSSETFTFVGSEARLSELVEQCFGAAKDTDWARMRCMPCDKLINKMHLKTHIAVKHLKKALHSCNLCDYVNSDLSAGKVNTHVKNIHKRQPGPDTIDSSQAQHYAPIIKNMIPQIFSEG